MPIGDAVGDKATMSLFRLCLSIFISVLGAVTVVLLVWFGNKTVDSNNKITVLVNDNAHFNEALRDMNAKINNLVTQDQMKVEAQKLTIDQLKFQNQILDRLKDYPKTGAIP